jgi:hypothetical protein
VHLDYLYDKCGTFFGKWDAGQDLSSEGREFHWVTSQKDNEWIPRSVRARGGMSRCSPFEFLMMRPLVMRAIASMCPCPRRDTFGRKSSRCTWAADPHLAAAICSATEFAARTQIGGRVSGRFQISLAINLINVNIWIYNRLSANQNMNSFKIKLKSLLCKCYEEDI